MFHVFRSRAGRVGSERRQPARSHFARRCHAPQRATRFQGAAEALEPRWMLDGDPVPNFALRDVNPNSDSYDQFISPRNYQGDISAWYFGHST